MSDDAPLPPRDHNRPPQPMTAAEVVALLDDECRALRRRQEEIIKGGERFKKANATITTDEQASKAADFAGQKGAMATFLAMAEAARVSNKRPFDDASNAVQGWFRALTEPVSLLQQDVRNRIASYLTEKEDREKQRLAEEALAAAKRAEELEKQALQTLMQSDLIQAQRAAEEAERLAEARPDTTVHGRLGGSSHIRRRWAFVEEDSVLLDLVKAVADGKAPLKYLQFNSKAIGYAVRSERLRSLAGCSIRQVRDV